MNVLSLFDGMSCGRIALERAGIPVTKYYASEIDKYATIVSEANYPDIVRLGDVTKWQSWGLPYQDIDLIIAGSPCQGFSFAGKQLAFDDPRSKLFFTFVDIVNIVKMFNPNVKFMLENVKMKKEHLAVISEALGVEPVFINSALVSAQNRQRYFWCNWQVEQPEDKGLLLADILDINGSYTYMSEKFVTRNKNILRNDLEGKAKSLSAMEYVKNGRQGDYIKCGRIVGRKVNPDTGRRDDYNPSIKAKQRFEARYDDKSGALTTVQKDNVPQVFSVRDNDRVHSVSETKSGYRPHKNDTRKSGISEIGVIGKPSNKSCTITAAHAPKLALNTDASDLKYRKLTPVECERLQTVPDNYTNHVSNTQRYKMLGNGWTVDVIAHLFKSMHC